MFGCRSLSSWSSIEMDGSDLGGFSSRHDCCQLTVLMYFRSTWEYGFSIDLIRICKYFGLHSYYQLKQIIWSNAQILVTSVTKSVLLFSGCHSNMYISHNNESTVIICPHVVPNPCDFLFLSLDTRGNILKNVDAALFPYSECEHLQREHLLLCTVKKRLIKTSQNLRLWKEQDLQVSHLLCKCKIFSL